MGLTALQKLAKLVSKNSTTIMTVIGVTGVISTTGMAIRATPKALRLIEKEVNERYPTYNYAVLYSPFLLGTCDTIKVVWRCYLPSILIGMVTAGCIISANSINLKRNAALASMYTLTETTLKQYQAKVIETIGEGKAQKIKDEVYSEKIKNNPINNNEVTITGKGDMLCYEVTSGRYFKSDIEHVRKVQNELNETLLNSDFVVLNDLYYSLGLPETSIGNEMGWDIERGLIKITFSSQLNEHGVPCLVIDSSPEYNYRNS